MKLQEFLSEYRGYYLSVYRVEIDAEEAVLTLLPQANGIVGNLALRPAVALRVPLCSELPVAVLVNDLGEADPNTYEYLDQKDHLKGLYHGLIT